MSIINVGELFYMLYRKGGAGRAEQALRFVGRAGIVIEPASNERVMAAARLKARVALSYADAFAAELAREIDATLVTGDSEFQPLAGDIAILWLPPLA